MPRYMNPETDPEKLKRPTYVTFKVDDLLDNLWESSAKGDAAAVNLILEMFPDLEHQSFTKGGYTPFLVAVYNNRIDCVRAFFENGAVSLDQQFGSTKNTAAHVAYLRGHREVLSLLSEAGANLAIKNADGESVANKLADEKRIVSGEDAVTRALDAPRASTAVAPMYQAQLSCSQELKTTNATNSDNTELYKTRRSLVSSG